jgi:hypothetical protein
VSFTTATTLAPSSIHKKHFYRFGAVGSPDIICVIDGIFVAIEVIALHGKQSEHQKEFQENLEAAGAIYILAYSLDDVIAKLPNDSGLRRYPQSV